MNLNNHDKTSKARSDHPGEYGMTLGNVWFTSDTHCNNFVKLLEMFRAARNPEYAAACYIVSHPEIFNRVNWDNISTPVEWYWGKWIGKDDNDPNGYHDESQLVAQLSSSYRSLARAAVELFTGSRHYFALMDLIGNSDDEVYKVFIQSLELRRDQFVIDIQKC